MSDPHKINNLEFDRIIKAMTDDRYSPPQAILEGMRLMTQAITELTLTIQSEGSQTRASVDGLKDSLDEA